MKRVCLTLFATILAGTAFSLPALGWAAHVNVIELDNQIISPVTQQYLVKAVERSEQDGAECLVVLLDTPGGLLESTRAIVKRLMNARVPVVVYVAPSGARAGSAGVFITLAGHIAAMAPSTNIGAAHPVAVGEGGGPVKKLIKRIKRAAKDEFGKPSKPDEEEIVEEESKDPMADKIINDTVAWVTTIARTRHRNEAWAKKAVTESVSVTEAEAVQEHIVDLIAKDLEDLLQKIDGWPVELPDGTRTLATAEARPATIVMSPREQFLAVITNPNIAYLLMLLGTLGLIFEFTHPGIGFPGIAGLICLILALYAFQALPINYAALALMGIGVLLLIAEVQVVSHGLLALGGVIALTLGSLMLVGHAEPALRISLYVILPTVATLAAIVLFVVQRALRSQTQPVTTGPQGLQGELGTASTNLDPDGMVFVHGELWNATSAAPIRQGERVRVLSVQGLKLTVEKV
ncbi:MAG: nodulation protein NfeD [Candidatus Omnitrophica bacterium]|nr:nodulation protein NfeD [Candidatus Omnitrophota bacterium]